MSDLGDLLELMHTARARPWTVRAVIHEWANLPRWMESGVRYQEMVSQQGGRVARLGDEPEMMQDTREGIYRVWRAYPGNFWRIESTRPTRQYVKILNERRWYLSDAGGSLTSNVRKDGLTTSMGVSTHGDRFIEVMLDPAFLTSNLIIEAGDDRTWAGRLAKAGTGKWRPEIDLDNLDWPYADETRILVDAQYGVLLRLEMLLGGEPFIRWQVNEIAFDESFPETIFEP